MKFNTLVKLFGLTLLLCAGVAGCKNPQRLTPLPGRGSGAIGESPSTLIAPTPPVTETKPPTETPGGIPTTLRDFSKWNSDGGETFHAQIVYFDYDKSTVKSSETPKVEEVARRMKSEFIGKALRVEGHCDERGTEEYNRALGERRALAVREYLVRLGIDAEMIDTISFGEDRPADPGHNDTAWSKNRRAVFDLLTPPGAAASK